MIYRNDGYTKPCDKPPNICLTADAALLPAAGICLCHTYVPEACMQHALLVEQLLARVHHPPVAFVEKEKVCLHVCLPCLLPTKADTGIC